MPYCVNCGAEVREGARFCNVCGKPIVQETPEAAQKPYVPLPPTESAASTGTAKMLILTGLGLYVLAAVLTLMTGNIIGIVIALAVVGVSYALAYVPLAKGDVQAARNGAAIAGGIALVLTLLNFMLGDFGAAIFNAIAAAAFGVAWNQIK